MKNKNLNDQFQKKKKEIQHLLETQKNNLNDKIATVRATKKIDNNKFISAFNVLLKK